MKAVFILSINKWFGDDFVSAGSVVHAVAISDNVQWIYTLYTIAIWFCLGFSFWRLFEKISLNNSNILFATNIKN